MRVRLLAVTPDAEKLIAAAARLCYSSRPVDELMGNISHKEKIRLIRMLRDSGHLTPFEHALLSFSVEGLSRAALAQFTRHRMASFSVRSQRHVKSDRSGWVVPPTMEADADVKAKFELISQQIADAYEWFLEMGIPKEDARFCLPQAAPTALIVSMNARELLWVARLRMCHTSQWEVRRVVTHMVRLARREMPTVFEYAGPPCRSEGKCIEHTGPCKLGARLNRWFRSVTGRVEHSGTESNRRSKSSSRGTASGQKT